MKYSNALLALCAGLLISGNVSAQLDAQLTHALLAFNQRDGFDFAYEDSEKVTAKDLPKLIVQVIKGYFQRVPATFTGSGKVISIKIDPYSLKIIRPGNINIEITPRSIQQINDEIKEFGLDISEAREHATLCFKVGFNMILTSGTSIETMYEKLAKLLSIDIETLKSGDEFTSPCHIETIPGKYYAKAFTSLEVRIPLHKAREHIADPLIFDLVHHFNTMINGNILAIS